MSSEESRSRIRHGVFWAALAFSLVVLVFFPPACIGCGGLTYDAAAAEQVAVPGDGLAWYEVGAMPVLLISAGLVPVVVAYSKVHQWRANRA